MSSGGLDWRLGHRPALDGLRGVAILLVVLCHLLDRVRFLALGSAGVTLFFVLSGFLITTLLLEEHGRTGRVDLSKFYRRRALRLLPAIVVVVGAVTVVRAYLGSSRDAVGDATSILFYYGNWASIEDRLTPLQSTWSLAVEEQFYLVWPIALLIALKLGGRRLVAWVAVLGALASAVARIALAATGAAPDRIYLGTDTRADALLIGAGLAVYLGSRREGSGRPVLATLVLLPAVLVSLSDVPVVVYLLVPTVVALVGGAMTLWIAQGPGPSWARARPLVLLGQRSYGVYLWNGPVYYSIEPLGLSKPLAIPIMLALNLGAAWLSWRYVESPFLRLKKRYAAGRTEAHGVLAAGAQTPGHGPTRLLGRPASVRTPAAGIDMGQASAPATN